MTTPRARRVAPLAALVVSVLTLTACVDGRVPDAVPTAAPPTTSTSPGSPDAAPPAGVVVPVGAPTVVASGLTTPWSVAFLDGTALISQRDTGEILEIVGSRTRVVGTVPDLAAGGEGGLLGIAVRGERLYAYVTTANGNRVVRFDVRGAPGGYALGEAETVIDGIPSANIHNGGRIAFGPDGLLYITTGDAARSASSRDPDSLAGKILRVTADGDVPSDNPVAGSAVWSRGHRNPQGIGWDAAGTMFASEFGQDTWDELNVIEPGADYGWPEAEGVGGDPRFVDPVQQWAPVDASPSGLAVVEGTIFVANLRGQRLRAIPVGDPARAREFFVGEFGRLRDVVAAPDGSLWVVTSNTDRGGGSSDRILRLELGPE